jgi:hypothetical protein
MIRGSTALVAEVAFWPDASRLGNQAMQRLLCAGVIQPKLAVSRPVDVYEQEAERAAEQVMRMPASHALESAATFRESRGTK